MASLHHVARKPIPVKPPRLPSDDEQKTGIDLDPWSPTFPLMPPTFVPDPINQQAADNNKNRLSHMPSYSPPTTTPITTPEPSPTPSLHQPLHGIWSYELAKKWFPDPYVESRAVVGLKRKTFKKFIRDLDAAFVLFYNPCEQKCCEAKVSMRQAAHTTVKENHAFAAVDCSQETELCKQEKVLTIPTMKLYAKGMTVDTYTHKILLSREIRAFVENAPLVREHVLEGKRCTIQ